jgi:7-carboxy-7-deazaguanine synthase
MKSVRYSLAPDGVFWTIQGEGALLGEPMVFVRLAGCSVGCGGCDTNYTLAREIDLDALIAEILVVAPAGWPWAWVWITGGEPTDQDLSPLLSALRARGYRVALATSGVRALPLEWIEHLNWISVSPHGGTWEQRHGHEVKLVPGLGGLTWASLTLLECGSFPYRFIQPMPGRAETERAVAFVKQHPGWRLSPQAHKGWRIA